MIKKMLKILFWPISTANAITPDTNKNFLVAKMFLTLFGLLMSMIIVMGVINLYIPGTHKSEIYSWIILSSLLYLVSGAMTALVYRYHHGEKISEL